MFLEIVTPDEKVFEGEVMHATFPGADGSFQVLNNHAAMVSVLGKGDIKYQQEKQKEEKERQEQAGILFRRKLCKI